MSKKVISILLSAAMLVAMFCVGFGALSASADDNVTYYFLAPDNYFKTEAGASNTDVGYYFWEAGGNGDWPGQAATAAPEVHPNAFKISVPGNDDVATIIFNAFVDAGNPADPALAAVAHQTENINVEAQNYDGYIYVLAQDEAHQSVNEFSGAITTSGNWFTLDEFKNSDNYKTYGFADDAAETKDTPAPITGKEWKAGATVTVTYSIGNIDSIGSVSSVVNYDPSVLKFVSKAKSEEPDLKYNKTFLANETAGDNEISIGATFDPEGADHIFAADKVVAWTFTFEALQDFNESDLGLALSTDKLVQITDNGASTVDIIDGNAVVNAINGKTETTDYVELGYTISGEKNNAGSNDTDTATDTATDTDSATDTASATDTTTDKASDSDKKDTKDPSSDSKTTSSSTTSTSTTTSSSTPTVQTAGTFAVISLVVILMAAAGVVIYTRKKTEE